MPAGATRHRRTGSCREVRPGSLEGEARAHPFLLAGTTVSRRVRRGYRAVQPKAADHPCCRESHKITCRSSSAHPTPKKANHQKLQWLPNLARSAPKFGLFQLFFEEYSVFRNRGFCAQVQAGGARWKYEYDSASQARGPAARFRACQDWALCQIAQRPQAEGSIGTKNRRENG